MKAVDRREAGEAVEHEGRVRVTVGDDRLMIRIAPRDPPWPTLSDVITMCLGVVLVPHLITWVVLLVALMTGYLPPGSREPGAEFLVLGLLIYPPFIGLFYQAYFWRRQGEEVVTVSDGVLSIERIIPHWTRRRDTGSARITAVAARRNRLYVGFPFMSMWPQDVIGFILDFQQGTVDVQRGHAESDSLRFGIQLDDREAKVAARALAAHLGVAGAET